ncbi:MAG TPA: hypothetical protein VGG10_13695 [Rhizomicrobium sp.]
MLHSRKTKSSSVNNVVGDPHWFPVDLDRARQELLFVRVGRSTLASLPFLTSDVWDVSQLDYCRIRLAEIFTLRGDTPSTEANFVWHTAFCCSTLLSRVLDSCGHNLSLREPAVLTRLADLKREGVFSRNAANARVPAIVLNLLGRTFPNEANVTIKASNATNALLPEVTHATSGKMLFLYSDCRSFLAALIRRGQEGMTYARRLFAGILGDGNAQAEWPIDKLFQMSDLQIGALAWHMQIAQFNRVWPLLGPSRAVSLDCDAFLLSPASTLMRLDAFFGLGLGLDHAASVIRGQMLRRNAKDSAKPSGAWRRRQEQRSIGHKLSREIDGVVAWSYDVCPATPRDLPVPNPVLPIEKFYRP